jgi:ribosome-binding protein aMBF1 (putative translation factor)
VLNSYETATYSLNYTKEGEKMAKNDEWCEFCNEKMKQTTVMVNGKEWAVCKQCKNLTVEGKQ